MLCLSMFVFQLKTYEETMNLNQTVMTEFLLLGFSTSPERQFLLFVAVLAIYLVTVMGNLLIILVTLVDPTLHTSMYFFLSNLSALEVGYTSVTVPKMLVSLISGDKRISFTSCAVQMFFFLCFGITESSFLATMAYDRYVAICNPLCYPMIMNKKVCVLLAATSWTIGIPAQVVQTSLVFTLPFCSSKKINHFFCDSAPLLLLACADTSMNETLTYMVVTFFGMVPFALILLSYIWIIATIIKMTSAEGKRKIFSTCSSHLIVVALFYGSGIILYLQPRSSEFPDSGKLLSLFYTVLPAMLNPFIYSLRNREIQTALRRHMWHKMVPCYP
ncbi:olfactory receptor 10A2-like [Malaclemys terrapin pileata]|uniref:olfactory receptor 10A2-like n=1 Tax=Malaclemys terrapin pileata TaxID=2991368 RepID=UPI0023A79A51|nr:olfactory receptor 10A2-like [Malaclemys terrapin pileata]